MELVKEYKETFDEFISAFMDEHQSSITEIMLNCNFIECTNSLMAYYKDKLSSRDKLVKRLNTLMKNHNIDLEKATRADDQFCILMYKNAAMFAQQMDFFE